MTAQEASSNRPKGRPAADAGSIYDDPSPTRAQLVRTFSSTITSKCVQRHYSIIMEYI